MGSRPRSSEVNRGPHGSEVNRENHELLRGKEEDHEVLGEKGEKNHVTLAEWGPHGGNTADGAGSLNHGLLLLFLRYGTPDWAEGEGRTGCVCGYSKGHLVF